jgi:hypothetical protein
MASIKLAALMSRLRDLDIQRVEIRYDGSGDSGAVEDVEFYKEKWETVDVSEDIQNQCEDLAYHILNYNYNWDWYNNDGGYGSVIIIPGDDHISIEGYVRSVTEADELVSTDNLEW